MRFCLSSGSRLAPYTAVLIAVRIVICQPLGGVDSVFSLEVPKTALGASIKHDPSFVSFSFEPAFWVEFFGNSSSPNKLAFDLLGCIVDHGGQPTIRPGGITMDSMIFNASAGDPVRTTNVKGGVYRTTVGPAYYKSWSNFPEGTKFVSTLNFGNDSLDFARDLAVASVKYASNDSISFFELGNEPTNYPGSRWKNSTEAYVQQWKNWTAQIDAAVNMTLGADTAVEFGSERWWASSATTDQTGLEVLPDIIIPAGIDSRNQVADYSIHSYPFSTCDPARAELATIQNILNQTELARYADEDIYPSAKAALDAGNRWIIGEFNSISCSGNPNVSDTFAQALWVIQSELIYAVRNASAVYLHQGAALVFQSSQQVNSAGQNGSPGYSTYDMFYPQDSEKRGPARVLPSFSSQLFMAEAFAIPETRVRQLETPSGIDKDYFSAYAFYVNDELNKLAIINSKPYYANSTSDFTAILDISKYGHSKKGIRAWLKRLSAPYINEGNANNTTWAGQAFDQGHGTGDLLIETVGRDGLVHVRGSEAVLVFFDKRDANMDAC
ncbi:glycoside hydrolase family 79 protein, partial [Aureobasidium melanogenum]